MCAPRAETECLDSDNLSSMAIYVRCPTPSGFFHSERLNYIGWMTFLSSWPVSPSYRYLKASTTAGHRQFVTHYRNWTFKEDFMLTKFSFSNYLTALQKNSFNPVGHIVILRGCRLRSRSFRMVPIETQPVAARWLFNIHPT
jgi:hypothetical protein